MYTLFLFVNCAPSDENFGKSVQSFYIFEAVRGTTTLKAIQSLTSALTFHNGKDMQVPGVLLKRTVFDAAHFPKIRLTIHLHEEHI